MKVTGIRVEFSKRLNDGNYGHEQANIQYVVDLDEGEDPDATVCEFLARGRAEALGQLRLSENYRIRTALALPAGDGTADHPMGFCPECGDPASMCRCDQEEEEDEEDDELERGSEAQFICPDCGMRLIFETRAGDGLPVFGCSVCKKHYNCAVREGEPIPAFLAREGEEVIYGDDGPLAENDDEERETAEKLGL